MRENQSDGKDCSQSLKSKSESLGVRESGVFVENKKEKRGMSREWKKEGIVDRVWVCGLHCSRIWARFKNGLLHLQQPHHS